MTFDSVKSILQAFLGYEITYDDAEDLIKNLIFKKDVVITIQAKKQIVEVLNRLAYRRCNFTYAVRLIEQLAAPAPESAEKDTSVKVLNVWAIFTLGGDILFATIAHSEDAAWVSYFRTASAFAVHTDFVAKQIDLSVTVK